MQFFRLREAVTDWLLSQQLGGSDLPPWQRALQLASPYLAFLDIAPLEEAVRIADELEPLARKIGHSIWVVLCLSGRARIEFGKAPDLAKLEAGFERVRKADQEASSAQLKVVSEVPLSLVDFFRGNWTSALSHARAASRPEPGSSIDGLGVGTLFRQLTYLGDRDGALAILDEKRALLPRSGRPNTTGSWSMLALVIEGLVMLGEDSQAGQLYPLACELIGTGAIALWPFLHFTQTIAAIAAAAARQWEATEEHFQIAQRHAESFPNVLEQAEIRRFRAMMLIDRAAPGDREKAQTLLRGALESYTEIGMPATSR